MGDMSDSPDCLTRAMYLWSWNLKLNTVIETLSNEGIPVTLQHKLHLYPCVKLHTVTQTVGCREYHCGVKRDNNLI